jgi:hypothetical protein
MSDQYQHDRQALERRHLERLQAELARRRISAEIVIPNPDRPYPTLTIYQPGRRYPVTSVWYYHPGEQVPGAHDTTGTGLVARVALIPVYAWGDSLEQVHDAQQVAHTAHRIAATYRAPAD